MAQNSLKNCKMGKRTRDSITYGSDETSIFKSWRRTSNESSKWNNCSCTKKEKKLALAERFANYDGPTEQKEIWSDEIVGKEEI